MSSKETTPLIKAIRTLKASSKAEKDALLTVLLADPADPEVRQLTEALEEELGLRVKENFPMVDDGKGGKVRSGGEHSAEPLPPGGTRHKTHDGVYKARP